MNGTGIVIAVAILFPLFGAAVFFWWRKQYGVWSRTLRSDATNRQTQIIDDDAFTRGAMMGMMGQQMLDQSHSRTPASRSDAGAPHAPSETPSPPGVDSGLYDAGGSSFDGGSAFSSDSGGAGGGSFDSGGGSDGGGGGGGGGGE